MKSNRERLIDIYTEKGANWLAEEGLLDAASRECAELATRYWDERNIAEALSEFPVLCGGARTPSEERIAYLKAMKEAS